MTNDLYYKPGSFYRISDRSGFKIRAEESRKEWTGAYVSAREWEPRQPQDFVKGVLDDQSVPDPRPRQTNVFLGPFQTSVAAAAVAGDISVLLASTAGMQIGDTVCIILDDGTSLITTISGFGLSQSMITEAGDFMITEAGIQMITETDTSNANYIVIAGVFPSTASVGNVVLDWTDSVPANINQ